MSNPTLNQNSNKKQKCSNRSGNSLDKPKINLTEEDITAIEYLIQQKCSNGPDKPLIMTQLGGVNIPNITWKSIGLCMNNKVIPDNFCKIQPTRRIAWGPNETNKQKLTTISNALSADIIFNMLKSKMLDPKNVTALRVTNKSLSNAATSVIVTERELDGFDLSNDALAYGSESAKECICNIFKSVGQQQICFNLCTIKDKTIDVYKSFEFTFENNIYNCSIYNENSLIISISHSRIDVLAEYFVKNYIDDYFYSNDKNKINDVDAFFGKDTLIISDTYDYITSKLHPDIVKTFLFWNNKRTFLSQDKNIIKYMSKGKYIVSYRNSPIFAEKLLQFFPTAPVTPTPSPSTQPQSTPPNNSRPTQSFGMSPEEFAIYARTNYNYDRDVRVLKTSLTIQIMNLIKNGSYSQVIKQFIQQGKTLDDLVESYIKEKFDEMFREQLYMIINHNLTHSTNSDIKIWQNQIKNNDKTKYNKLYKFFTDFLENNNEINATINIDNFISTHLNDDKIMKMITKPVILGVIEDINNEAVHIWNKAEENCRYTYATVIYDRAKEYIDNLNRTCKDLLDGNVTDLLEKIQQNRQQEQDRGGGRHVKKCIKTDKRIQHNGRVRIVYCGPKGGKYIKMKGVYVSIAKLSKAH